MARAIAGVGIGLRDDLANDLLATTREVDWLEITPENWLCQGGWAGRVVDACLERWPMSPHCVSVSVVGREPFDAAWLGEVERLSRRAGAPWWSDHLACSTFGGVVTGQLMPIPTTLPFLDLAVTRVTELMGRTSAPLALENLTAYARAPAATREEAIDEPEFLHRIAEATGAGILLDVNTVYINAENHGFDAAAWLDRLPLEHVWQIHLAGHSRTDRLVMDDHTGPVPDAVWALYRRVLRRAGRMIPTLIEWDTGVPSLDALLDEVDRAREQARWALVAEADAPA